MGISPVVSPSVAPTSSRTADVLLSRTQQRVLGLLFAQPERSYFASEVIQLAECGSGTVQRELARLCECGLVQAQMQGRQKHYQANRHAPAFTPLRQLLATLQSPWLPLQEALSRLPDRVLLARVQVSSESDNGLPHWRLLLVAHNLKLSDVFALLKPIEHEVKACIEPLLFEPEAFIRLKEKKAPQLRALLSDETYTLVGSMDTVTHVA